MKSIVCRDIPASFKLSLGGSRLLNEFIISSSVSEENFALFDLEYLL